MDKYAKQKTDEPKEMSTLAFVLWLIGGGVLILALGSIPLIVALTYLPKQTVPNDAGLIGDSFGLVNALVSGLAFIGLIVTLRMQKQELRLQRQELKETREQFERSATAQEESEKQLQRQVDLMYVSSYLSLLQMQKADPSQAQIIMDRLKKENEQALSRLARPFDEHCVEFLDASFADLRQLHNTISAQFRDDIHSNNNEMKKDVNTFHDCAVKFHKKVCEHLENTDLGDYPKLHETLASIKHHLGQMAKYPENLSGTDHMSDTELTKIACKEYLDSMRERIESINGKLNFIKRNVGPAGPAI